VYATETEWDGKHLPLGSTASEVLEFLDARGSSNSGEVRGIQMSSDYPDELDLRLISASLPEKRGLFYSSKVYMSFRFDNNNRLIDYRVGKDLTGP
jgi:hypothetical protein